MYSKTHLINTFLLKEEYNNLFKSLPENTSATVFATDGFSLCGYVSHAPINKIKFIILEDYHSTKNVLVRYDVTFKQVLNEIKTSLKNNTILPYRNKDNTIINTKPILLSPTDLVKLLPDVSSLNIQKRYFSRDTVNYEWWERSNNEYTSNLEYTNFDFKIKYFSLTEKQFKSLLLTFWNFLDALQ
jgi:hypothetical protein